jgi:hypothetical protein
LFPTILEIHRYLIILLDISDYRGEEESERGREEGREGGKE